MISNSFSRKSRGISKAKNNGSFWMYGAALIVSILVIGYLVVDYVLQLEWFNEVHYSNVFWKIISTRAIIFLAVSLLTGLIYFFVVYRAYRVHLVTGNVLSANPSVRKLTQIFLKSPKTYLAGVTILVAVMFGLVCQSKWQLIQLFIHRKSFGIKDPQFGRDVGFYLFSLPFIQLVLQAIVSLLIMSLVSMIILYYFLGGIYFVNNRGKLSKEAKSQLAIIVGILLLVKAISYWFDRYDLLTITSTNGSFTGASYTDIHAYLPGKLILVAITFISALAFFSVLILKDMRIPLVSLSLTLISMLALGLVWPVALQRFSVTPNAKDKERQYIINNLSATKQAFNLTEKNVFYQKITANNDLKDTYRFSPADKFTINNLRLLDPNIVGTTFTQRQKLKNFYRFSNQLYMDRYLVNNHLADYVVGVRELDPNRIGESQKNWINLHTVYTHGNGIVLAPANRVDQEPGSDPLTNTARGGFPLFEVSDTTTGNKKILSNTLAVKQPRIYFGEIISATNEDYAIVSGSSPREYDYDNQYFKYDGKAGISIGNLFQRTLFAIKNKEINFILSNQIQKNSKVIMYRNPKVRVKKVAPWLTLDDRVYPVVAQNGSIKWIVDGYTTMDNYPYAQKISINNASLDARNSLKKNVRNTVADPQISYMRNSVKAVVDAYDGTVDLYQQDDTDPVLSAWMDIFPGTIKPKKEIPADLAAHFRYPEDIFKVQRELLTRYHVTDPDVFFSGNDMWTVPIDQPVKNQNNNQEFKQPPYYVLASDPVTGTPSFQLNSVYRASGRNSENLTGYLTANSEPDKYGQLTLKILNTDNQTDGPKQVFEFMTNWPDVSKDKTLFESGSKLSFGNLLTLPLDNNNFLYITPLYIETKDENNAMPKLARVLVYYNKKVGYKPTVQEALAAVGIKLAGDNGQVMLPTEGKPIGVSNPIGRDDKLVSARLLTIIDKAIAARNSGNLTDLDKALDELEAAEKESTPAK